MNKHRWKARDIAQRLVIEGELILESPCRLTGGEANEVSDGPLLRDDDGVAFISGTTLAGLVRHYLTPRVNPEELKELLGPARQAEGNQSRLLFSEARCTAEAGVELRDGVAICPKSGIALDGKKYDLELLAVGSKFRIVLELLMPSGPSRLKSLLGIALHAFERGEIAVGGRSRRGYGQCRVQSWTVTDYPVATLDGLMSWLSRSGKSRPLNSGAEWMDGPWNTLSDDFSIIMNLRLPGSLLIASNGYGPDQPDRTHLTRKNGKALIEPVLSGTSLAGILRHQCLKIANTLGLPGDFVRKLFGDSGHASKVRVRESNLEGGSTLRHTRVRINPWTGGAADSLLFDQDCQFGGSVRVEVSARALCDAEKALLLLACRDLALGHLPVGGQGGVGRGRLEPSQPEFAQVTGPDCTFRFESGKVRIAPAGALDQLYQSLEEAIHVG
jgi:CRISPR/Cas system CSM-associated protein Csm3 (group 7 of RAMP superfamily)